MPNYRVELFAVHSYVYADIDAEAVSPEAAREMAVELANADEANLSVFESLPLKQHQWQVNESEPVEEL